MFMSDFEHFIETHILGKNHEQILKRDLWIHYFCIYLEQKISNFGKFLKVEKGLIKKFGKIVSWHVLHKN